jgi:hypothetical protein
MNSNLDNIPDFTNPNLGVRMEVYPNGNRTKHREIARHTHVEEFASSIMYVQFAANKIFLMLALLAFCPTRVSKRPLLLPCIENSHVITDYPVFSVSLYSAAVDISSVHNIKDRRRRGQNSPINPPDKRVRSQEPNRAAQQSINHAGRETIAEEQQPAHEAFNV